MLDFVNLTPHDVVVAGRTIVRSGYVLRVGTVERKTRDIGIIPVYKTEHTGLILESRDLSISEGVLDYLKWMFPHANFIVSLATAQYIKSEFPEYASRFFVPTRMIRDESGNVIGAEALGEL